MKKAKIIIVTVILLGILIGVVYADLTGTEGLAIDLSSAGAGTDFTIAFDPTELDAVTWSDSANASNIWTFDVSGTDHTMTAGNGLMTFSHALTVDALGTFNLGLTITTGDPLTLGVVRWDNGSDKMDGEQIADNTIDVDSLDWGAFTDLGESGAVTWGNIAAGELADNTVDSDDFVHEDWGEVTNASGSVVIDDSVTVTGWVLGTSTATQLTSPTLITNLIDTTGAADMDYGSADVLDHTFTEGDSTFIIDGGITVSTGDTITVGVVQWDDGSDAIDGEVIADNTIDDDSIDWTDVTGVDITLTDAAAITSSASITATTSFIGPLFDAAGDEDMDYGSADVDDHTFIADGGTVVIDGSIQFPTADASPAATGELQYDSTVAGMSGGALRWYDDDSVRILVDLETDASDDDYVVAYDADADGFYMKADAGAGGGMDSFIAEDADGTEVSISDAEEWKFIESTGIDIDWTDTSTGSDADPFDLTFTIDITAIAGGIAEGEIANSVIIGADIKDDTIDSADYAAASIDNEHLANNAVDSDELAAGSVDQAHFAVDVIGQDEMADVDHGDGSWSGGALTIEAMTMLDAATSAYYVGMWDTDGAGSGATVFTDTELTYTEASGTLAATEFSGGGANLTAIDAATGDSATAFFDAGTIEHEWGGLQADVSGWTGLFGITGADTSVEVDELSELLTAMSDVTAFITDDDMPAASANPTINAAGEIGRDTDGANETGDSSLRGYDGSNQFLYSKKLKTLNFTLISPDTIDAADLIPVWHNTSGMTFTITEIKVWSDDDDVNLEIEELTDMTDFTARTLCDTVVVETDGTGVFYDAGHSASDHAAIEHDHSLAVDFDTDDTPDYVQISITGWFNSAVD